MIHRDDEIQAALVAYLKADATIAAQLIADGTTVAEIREDQWQGASFTYPAVRVRMISNVPTSDRRDGCRQNISFGIQAWSEDDSSQQSDRIAGIIGGVLHGRSFSANSLVFHTTVTNLVPAVRSDRTVWRSETLVSGIVSG
jgi:hypothetical protein